MKTVCSAELSSLALPFQEHFVHFKDELLFKRCANWNTVLDYLIYLYCSCLVLMISLRYFTHISKFLLSLCQDACDFVPSSLTCVLCSTALTDIRTHNYGPLLHPSLNLCSHFSNIL
jgi:hypothetical protein